MTELEQTLDYRKRYANIHHDLCTILCQKYAKDDTEYLRNLLIAQKVIADDLHSFIEDTYKEEKEQTV